MKKLLLGLIYLSVSAVSAQKLKKPVISNSKKEFFSHQSIQLETDKIFQKLVEIRRDFHRNPELAGHEIRTQKMLKQYLIALGLEVKTDIYGYGVVGILRGGREGKKIAWRSDMDALSNDFPDPQPFKSETKGIQHGCGHDVHMAVGLGIAEVLAKNKKYLKGTVYFVFQPEEETFMGAKGMMNTNLFSKIAPDEIYGLHVTALPVGEIIVKPNEVFAYQKRIRIELQKELSKEEIKNLTNKIHTSLSRMNTGSKPWEIRHIVDPDIGLINPNTIFKDYRFMDDKLSAYSKKDHFFLEAYLYETNASCIPEIIPEVKRLVEDIYKSQLISVSFIQENPTVINDEKLTGTAIKTIRDIYGINAISPDYGQVPFFNDDFAYFQQKIPGVYFLLGGSNFEKEMIAMNHSPNFQVDEESIRTGVKYFSSLIIERLYKN
ncbi:M20/M25/M40 family metallo-hydrolase [Chryseobacterium sp. Chry.R1]|uniref:M20 metallopeptidase family protein n=1 Tax=Chryseobacterium sp. Chry.R1 TaxID=3139392 RepID=UPI0031FA4405